MTITHIDTACVLININGFTIMTDPVLDRAGSLYYHGYGAFSRKTGIPSYTLEEISQPDLVLLSHHRHKDNLDHTGRKVLNQAKQVISTIPASKTIPGITGIQEWESVSIPTQRLTDLRITATPAQHRPAWVPEFVAGKTIGFILEYKEQQNGALYISGDTVLFKGLKEIGKKFPIDTAIVHLGSAQFRYLAGFGKFTMESHDLIKADKFLKPNQIIPVHYKGWSHFKEEEDRMRKTVKANENLYQKTIMPDSGNPVKL